MLMDMGLLQQEKGQISELFCARWRDEGVSYWGIKISSSGTNSYLLDNNIIPLMNKTQFQLDKW